MTGPSTAREALIVEAIGEVAQLMDRIEAVAPAMDEARQATRQSSAELARLFLAFESRMAAITENAKTQAVQHIASRTNEMARNTLDTQTRAMEEAARALFRTEVGPALQRLVMPLQDVAERIDHPWQQWLTHAATAVLASALTWALVYYLWVH